MIFIHSEYIDRLSEELIKYFLDILENSDDYFPVAYVANQTNYYIYYVNVNTLCDDFNKIYFAFYCPWFEPRPIKNDEGRQVYDGDYPIPRTRRLFISFEQQKIKEEIGITEFGG